MNDNLYRHIKLFLKKMLIRCIPSAPKPKGLLSTGVNLGDCHTLSKGCPADNEANLAAVDLFGILGLGRGVVRAFLRNSRRKSDFARHLTARRYSSSERNLSYANLFFLGQTKGSPDQSKRVRLFEKA